MPRRIICTTTPDPCRYNEYFSCSFCLKLRVRSAFTDGQVDETHERGQTGYNRRICLECGVKKGVYLSGKIIKLGGCTRFVCGLCRRTYALGLFCVFCGNCQQCIESRRDMTYPQLVNLEEEDDRSSCTFCSNPY